jgi:hypothetical protein
MRGRRTKTVVSLIVVLGLLFAGWLAFPSGVVVRLHNASAAEISDIRVIFEGGAKTARQLQPGEFFKCRISPDSESDLEIEFVNASGVRQTVNLDVYLDRYHGGSIEITIQSDDKVSFEDKTTI